MTDSKTFKDFALDYTIARWLNLDCDCGQERCIGMIAAYFRADLGHLYDNHSNGWAEVVSEYQKLQ